MSDAEPALILLTHDRWATGNLLDSCAALSDEQFHREFEMGPGSLHNTLVHVLGAMRGWTDMLRGEMLPPKEPRPRLESEGDMSAVELAALLPIIGDEFEAAVRTGSFDDDILGERGGKSYGFKRGAILTHVTTHAMHHRAQCLNMLRQLGVDPLPAGSVMEWSMMANRSVAS